MRVFHSFVIYHHYVAALLRQQLLGITLMDIAIWQVLTFRHSAVAHTYVYIHAGRVPIYLYNTCIKGGCIFSLNVPVCYIHTYVCACMSIWGVGRSL